MRCHEKNIIFNDGDHIMFTYHRLILKFYAQMQENVSSFKFIHKLKQSLHFQKIYIMVVKNLGNSKIYSEFQEFFLENIQ